MFQFSNLRGNSGVRHACGSAQKQLSNTYQLITIRDIALKYAQIE